MGHRKRIRKRRLNAKRNKALINAIFNFIRPLIRLTEEMMAFGVRQKGTDESDVK